MSRHLSMQPSQFSRVLKGEFHLKADHVFLACQFLELDTDQTEFVELLAEVCQSSVPSRIKHLKNRLEVLRSEIGNTKKAIDARSLHESEQQKGEAEIRYYTDPRYMILHMFLMTNYDSDNFNEFLERFNMDQVDLSLMISDLEGLEVIARLDEDPTRFKVIKDRIHLEKTSSLQSAYITAIRLKSLERIAEIPKEKRQSLSVTLAVSEGSENLIQQKINQFISDLGDICKESNAEKVYQFNLDFFPWLDS